jgi:hypothetical protein
MKGPFGLLLIGGGIILIVGLFTGKIQFPGGSTTTASTTTPTNTGPGGSYQPTGNQVPVNNTPGGQKCPAGYSAVGGICVKNGTVGGAGAK